MADSCFALITLPLAGAALVMVARLIPSGIVKRLVYYAGVIVALALPWIPFARLALYMYTGGSAIQGNVGSWPGLSGIAFKFDGLSVCIIFMGMLVSLPAWLYSRGVKLDYELFDSVFFVQLAFLAASAITADLFNLFVCLEVLGITSYVLVVFSDKPAALLASLSYLLVSASSMLFFLLGVFFIYNCTGALSYDALAERIPLLSAQHGIEITMALVLITASIALRVAMLPVYGWLPDAHAMAPHPVSAVLSGILIKTPLFILLRFLLIFSESVFIGKAFAVGGAVTALVGVVLALSQTDVKRLLAYHSISQIGFIVCAWGAALSLGLSSGVGLALLAASYLHALYHGIFKGTLFLAVGSVADASGSRDVYAVQNGVGHLDARGYSGWMVALAFAAGALSISAIPPWNGYVSKSLLTYFVQNRVMYWVLAVASAGTVASFIKLSRIFWPSRKAEYSVNPDSRRLISPVQDSCMFIALMLGVVFCFVGGLAGTAVFQLVHRLLSAWMGIDGGFDVGSILYSWKDILKTMAVTGAGVLLFFALRVKAPRRILTLLSSRERGFSGLFYSFFWGIAVLLLYILVSANYI